MDASQEVTFQYCGHSKIVSDQPVVASACSAFLLNRIRAGGQRPQMSRSINSRLPLVNIVRPEQCFRSLVTCQRLLTWNISSAVAVYCLWMVFLKGFDQSVNISCLLSVDGFPKRFWSVSTIWNINLPVIPLTLSQTSKRDTNTCRTRLFIRWKRPFQLSMCGHSSSPPLIQEAIQPKYVKHEHYFLALLVGKLLSIS